MQFTKGITMIDFEKTAKLTQKGQITLPKKVRDFPSCSHPAGLCRKQTQLR